MTLGHFVPVCGEILGAMKTHELTLCRGGQGLQERERVGTLHVRGEWAAAEDLPSLFCF